MDDRISPERKRNIDQVITRHMNRIRSLDNELSKLQKQILEIEEDEHLNKGAKEQESDKIINRMALHRHQIEVREDLIKWLTY